MRLVRGSILSSKPCTSSKAARILRRFLFSDAGTDVSVKSFLKRAARSLESKRDAESSSLRKPKRKRLEETTAIPYPEEDTEAEIADLEDGKHRKKNRRKTEVDANEQFSQIAEPQSEVSDKPTKKSRKKHSEEEEGPSEIKAEFDAKPEKKDSDLYDATLIGHNKQRKMLKENAFLTDDVTPSPGMKGLKIGISPQKEDETEQKRKDDRKHKKKGDAVKQYEEKADLESKGIPATQKKSKKLRSPDKFQHQQASEEDKSSSKKSEKHKASVNGVEGVDEPDHSRHSKKKMSGVAAEAGAGEHELHSKKKRRIDNTPR
jgi:hypothetical protein